MSRAEAGVGGKKRPRADLLSTLDAAFASTAQATDSKYTAQAAAQSDLPPKHKQQAYQHLKRKRKGDDKHVHEGNGRRKTRGQDHAKKETAAKQGKKQTEAAYEKMSTELLAIGLKDCSLHPQVQTLTKPRVLHETLKQYIESVTRGTKADSNAVASLKNKVLSLDNPFKKSAAADSAAKKTIAAASRIQTAKLLSARRRRELGLHLLSGEIQYNDVELLKEIWTRYVSQAIQNELSEVQHVTEEAQRSRNAKLHLKLKYLDLSGCPLEVVQSRNPCNIGLRGIVVAETQHTVQLCSPAPSSDDKNHHGSLRTLFKSGSSFRVHLNATRTLILDSTWFADRADVVNQ
uniref:Uncharacterized protein n=1 Tax=Peronospora matthiolae TaxID=2874970 RepID=A0AAV1VLV2_9STRA